MNSLLPCIVFAQTSIKTADALKLRTCNFDVYFLTDHVTDIKNFLTDLTRKDGFILMTGIFIGSVSILLIKRAVKDYRQRR